MVQSSLTDNISCASHVIVDHYERFVFTEFIIYLCPSWHTESVRSCFCKTFREIRIRLHQSFHIVLFTYQWRIKEGSLG